MRFTVRCSAGDDARLDEICRIFQSMARTAYSRLLEGKGQREVELMLLERYGVRNLLWRRNAIIQAKGTIEAQRKLLPLHVEELDWKIERVKAKACRTANPLKKKAFEARIQKLERRKAEFKAHIEDGTLPKVVFGGRKRIGSVEWRLKRRGQFFSVGDAWTGGNSNTRIQRDGEGLCLKIRSWHERESFTVPLRVSNAYRRVFEALADRKLEPVHPIKTEKGRRPYTVRVMKRVGGFECHVSFEVPQEPIHPWTGERLVSIDVNPIHIDAAIVNKDGNLVAGKTFREPALIYARRQKRLWLASNLVEKALKWAGFFGVDAVIIEKDLKLRGAEHGRTANRLIANFMHRRFLELVALKTLKREWILIRVPAAYSSRIASTKYKPTFPRMSTHQLAAFVLGRRALGLPERLAADQLKAVAGCVRKRQAWVKAIILQGHKHPYLTPRITADGRMGMQDAKGAEALTERVTPRIRYAAKLGRARMQRLSWLMPSSRRRSLRRMEAIRDDGWARAHRGNAPPPLSEAASR